ncbi:MAG: DUF481 domain-containing protein [Spirochaetaceae bacterium]|nr:MAG: DUF481 domain-containing protein [Spirochaetaceae bacterium]
MNRFVRTAALIVVSMLALSSCLTRPERLVSYYTFDSLPETERAELRIDTPHDASVQILDTRVARAFSRPQIVLRGIGPSFVYLNDHLWGVDLSETVADLIERRIRSYRIFGRTTREFTRERVAYELRSAIGSIEYLVFGNQRVATVEIDLVLVRMPDEREVVRYRNRAEAQIPADDVGVFVAEANRLIVREIDSFLERVLGYLATGEVVLFDAPATRTDSAADLPEAETTAEGVGELLLSGLGPAANQPFFTVRRTDTGDERTGRFGVSMTLEAGRYTVEYGDGPTDRRMRTDGVEIVPRRRTVLEPTWSVLTVSVVDATRRPVRVRYDLFESETGVSYGGALSPSEALASAQRVWVLRPGRYKVVLNSLPFATLEDFVTVSLVAGRSEELTIVVDVDETSGAVVLRGAGNIDAEESGDPTSPLSVSSAINASLAFSLDNADGRGDISTLTVVDSEIETDLTYEISPLRYELRSLVALGLSAADGAPLRVTSDRVRLRNTLLYAITPVYGFYTRVDADTTFFGERLLFEEPTGYIKRDGDRVVSQELDARTVRLSPPFMPLFLREGVGLSVQAVRTPRVELGLRGGLGAAQTIRLDTFEPAGTETIDDDLYAVYERGETVNDVGLEFSAFATVIPFANATVTSTADVFVPFDVERRWSLLLESTVNVVLINNVSLLYRVTLRNTAQPAPERLVQEHGVFVRLNYLLR